MERFAIGFACIGLILTILSYASGRGERDDARETGTFDPRTDMLARRGR